MTTAAAREAPSALRGRVDAVYYASPLFSAGRLRTDSGEVVSFAGELMVCEHDPVVNLPAEFIMIARVFGTLAGLFSQHRPDIDFMRHVLPVVGSALL